MNFDQWCAAHGVYLNDSDDAAKAAKGMARRAWEAAVAAERERCDEMRRLALRALVAWDESVLPKSNDGMMQERMEDLRDAVLLRA